MADSVDQAGSTEDMSLSNDDEKQCQFCATLNSKYLCPRCGVRYCSVPCYRNPSHLICSEDFFKQCIQEELASEDGRTEGKKQMLEALRRMHAEAGTEDDLLDSDDEEEDLATRLENVDLNNADLVWSSLTEAERAEFESLVASGEVDQILPVWTPWWGRTEKPMIEEVAKSPDTSTPDYPTLVPDIPLFYVICSVKPAPCLDFNMVNVLAAYVFIGRHYNGEPIYSASEAAHSMMRLSDNLAANANFSDREVAVQTVALNAVNMMKASSEDTGLIKLDVQDILSSKQFVLYALSDAHHILSHAKAQLKSRQKSDATRRSASKQSFSHRFPEAPSSASSSDFALTRTNLNAALKKLEYFMSWAKAYYTVDPEK